MPRYKIIVEYDGGPFVGWQRQDSGPSIQAALEDAVFALSGERVMVQGAGRTDAGVHAQGQVAHFEIAAEKRLEEVRGALTFHLKPHPVVVVSAEIAPEGFHSRFSATYRRYRYRILNRRTPAALERGHVWHVPVPLDTDAMQAAAGVLIGKHDFNSFRSINCQAKSSIKTLDALSVGRNGEEIAIEVGARSFLHNQVRILVGTLQLVGRGQWSKADVAEALAARDRTRAGPTAPPHGLCLMEVRYGSGDSGREADAEEAGDDE
ncbi:MAG TPA: tRNA pseudouridine(38-40) synthase TruA [Reyranella sp.]